jgi:hypothetical protein
MSDAFKPGTGPLTNLNAPVAEQHAARNLFVGAMGYFRNPLAHRRVSIAVPEQAASAILFANELIVIANRHFILRKTKQEQR